MRRRHILKLPSGLDLSPIPGDLDEHFDAEDRRRKLIYRRDERFFDPVTGLEAKFERAGDRLIQLMLIAFLVAGPELTPAQVVQRFVLAVSLGAFPTPGTGLHGVRRAVRDLIDLYNIDPGPHTLGFAAGQYVLRPSVFTVRMRPEAMRARRSIWIRWLVSLGWPVPIELQPPPPAPLTPEALQSLYDDRLTATHVPTHSEDRVWAAAIGITQDRAAALRRNNPDPRLRRHGRRS